MKIGRTAVGIVVAGAGKVHKRSDNSEILLPEIPLSPYLEFTFVIKVQNAYFRNYTLLPLKLNSSAIYLFSNDPTMYLVPALLPCPIPWLNLNLVVCITPVTSRIIEVY